MTSNELEIKWMRAEEIARNHNYAKPLLFKDGPTRFDINQGKLGDCWFLATLANLPAYPRVFDKVLDKSQSFENNPGIFCFKFWQYGEWVEVVIDDYLPTLNGKLLFLKSDSPDEFWTALIEKAYAKLYGNYTSALSGGLIGSSMEDLTGGVAESYFDQFPPFKVMLKAHQKGAMIGASIRLKGRQPKDDSIPIDTVSTSIEDLKKQKYEDIKKKLQEEKNTFEDPLFPKSQSSIGPINLNRTHPEEVFENGLVDGHAYSVTKVVEFEAKGEIHQLVRVRNPWGNQVEWNGAWSDKSPEWNNLSEKEKSDLGLINEQDGEFFIAYQDFVKQFSWLDICHISLDSFNDIGWFKQEIRGSCIKEPTSVGGMANIHLNPQYLVDLKDTDKDSDEICTSLISLLQVGGRRKKAEGMEFDEAFASIYFYLFNVSNEKVPMDKQSIYSAMGTARKSPSLPLRANTMRLEVPPGQYIIIPVTYQTDEELKFLLRVFSEMPVNLKQVNSMTP